CGAYVGLCLPRSRVATSVAKRPRTIPSASITCQARVMSPGLGVYVDTVLPRRQLVLQACGLDVRAARTPDGRAASHNDVPRYPAGRFPLAAGVSFGRRDHEKPMWPGRRWSDADRRAAARAASPDRHETCREWWPPRIRRAGYRRER